MARHGENIHKRADGRWEARIIVGYNDSNKAIYRSLYGKSYDEVKAKKEKLSGVNNAVIKSDLTFDQAADQWLASKKGKIKTTTYNHYSNQYELHIKPFFENRKLTALKDTDYNEFLQQKENDGYSSRTLILLRTILKMILLYAENTFHIPAVKNIFMPKKPKKQVEAFSRTEQTKLVQYLSEHSDHYSLAVIMSLYCGLRIGEVCALQWKDLNLDTGVVTVSKTLIRVQNKDKEESGKTKVVMQNPKTESSSRKVPMPESIRKEFLLRFHDDPDSFVITGTSHFMEPRVCLRKFKKIVTDLGMSEYTFHACRHTYATRCIELGIDAKILCELLGHASVKTTLDRYVHPSMDLKKEQVNKLTISAN